MKNKDYLLDIAFGAECQVAKWEFKTWYGRLFHVIIFLPCCLIQLLVQMALIPLGLIWYAIMYILDL